MQHGDHAWWDHPRRRRRHACLRPPLPATKTASSSFVCYDKLRRGLGKACWMFNWLQKKSGRTDRGVFVREQASYIVNHYLGPQFAAVLYGIAHDMELDRAGLGAATAEQGFGSMQIEPPASGAPMPAGLNRTLALEISIAPAGDRPVPG
ncbi:MAG: hypothetical protein ACLU37_07145, partial [Collinsella sp.]